MTILDALRLALTALRANILRSALTTLGIVIGVAGVIVMVAVGAGAQREVDRLISSLGSNMLVVFPGSSNTMGRSGGAGTTRPLAETDLEAINSKVPGVTAISGYLSGGNPLVRGNINWMTQVAGVHEGFTTVRDWPVVDGRELNAQDVRQGTRVLLVGQTVAQKLFPDQSPLGEMIRVRDVPFQIVGVLDSKGQSGIGRDQDDIVMAPITAVRGRIVGRSQVVTDQVGSLYVKFEDGTDLAEAQAEIETVLRQKRRVQPGAEADFSVRNLSEFLRARTATQTTLGWLLAAASAIALVVGGIGIMNIMLVSVTERTREIGLRMAVGARRNDILAQFLVEAILLCLLGGLAGAAIGVALAQTVAIAAQWPVQVSVETIAIALAAAGATGMLFGFFPARRAALLNPIDALRSE